MCLLRVSNAVLGSFADLTTIGVNENDACQKKLIRFAAEANAQYPGPLDNPAGCLRHMPTDLKHVRHYTIGVRHRIYISGHHKNCQYLAWHVKEFKRDGRDVEGSKAFSRTLRTALNDPANNVLTLSEENQVVVEEWVNPDAPDNDNIRA